MSPKERLNELIKIYGTGSGTKKEEKKDVPKAKIEHPVVKEYSNENIVLPVTMDRKRLQSLIQNAKPRKGRHWGSAETGNAVAKAVAFSSGNLFRPIDNNVKSKRVMIDDHMVAMGAGMRKYAQERIKQVPIDKHPEIYRGMTLPPEAFEAIMSGKEKNIELTGCTAFTFHKNIMDQYSQSSWTKGFGADKKSVKLVLQRDDNVDKSIGMWHDHKSDPTKPAFEILTGLDCVTVTKVDDPSKSKGTDPKVLSEKYAKQAKQYEKKIDKFQQENPVESTKWDVSHWSKGVPGVLPGNEGDIMQAIVSSPKGKFGIAISKMKKDIAEQEKQVYPPSNASGAQQEIESKKKFVEHLERDPSVMTKLQENFGKLDKDIQSKFLASGDKYELRRTMDYKVREARDSLEMKKSRRERYAEAFNTMGKDVGQFSDAHSMWKHYQAKDPNTSYDAVIKVWEELGSGEGKIPTIYVTAGRYKEDKVS